MAVWSITDPYVDSHFFAIDQLGISEMGRIARELHISLSIVSLQDL
ncbi:two-component system connector SafA [Escherichia coli]